MDTCSRKDQERATVVDRAIDLDARGARAQALALLVEHHVPDCVIGRVLCDPLRTRVALVAALLRTS